MEQRFDSVVALARALLPFAPNWQAIGAAAFADPAGSTLVLPAPKPKPEVLSVSRTTVTARSWGRRRADHFSDINGDLAYSRDDWSDARSSARAMQYVNAGFVGATVIGAGVTALLWAQRPNERSARVTPWVWPGSAGLAISGALQ